MYNVQCKHNTDCVQAAWESLPPNQQNFTELQNSRFYSRLSQIAKNCYLPGVPRKFFVADSKPFPTSLTQFVSRLLTSFFCMCNQFCKKLQHYHRMKKELATDDALLFEKGGLDNDTVLTAPMHCEAFEGG